MPLDLPIADTVVDDHRVCPICGSTVRFAFPNSTRYVTCRRSGHVTVLPITPGVL